MNVAVAYKWAANPSDAAVAPDGTVDWSRAKASISEYDPVAIELGRALATEVGAEYVGLSVGTSAVGAPLATKAAMSRGLDRGLVLADDATAGWTATQVAAALAALARRADARIVLTGDASVDENAKVVSALVAGHLGWPCLQEVTAVTSDGDGWLITQAVPGGTRQVAVGGPVVVAVTTDAAQPRVPGMKDILAAGKKPVEKLTATEVGVTDVALDVTARERPQARARKNQIFEGADAAARLAAALRSDGSL